MTIIIKKIIADKNSKALANKRATPCVYYQISNCIPYYVPISKWNHYMIHKKIHFYLLVIKSSSNSFLDSSLLFPANNLLMYNHYCFRQSKTSFLTFKLIPLISTESLSTQFTSISSSDLR